MSLTPTRDPLPLTHFHLPTPHTCTGVFYCSFRLRTPLFSPLFKFTYPNVYKTPEQKNSSEDMWIPLKWLLRTWNSFVQVLSQNTKQVHTYTQTVCTSKAIRSPGSPLIFQPPPQYTSAPGFYQPLDASRRACTTPSPPPHRQTSSLLALAHRSEVC